ncbi:hypothetical protein [Neorhizobium sp. P12A]|uniref:hypothetical protein n=1 Tax=Neorhizobium sp. P12A TaxID=2268027 RepID=UPI0011EE9212|nr:hypothetical protein [Neorhizobium sp. P12A]
MTAIIIHDLKGFRERKFAVPLSILTKSLDELSGSFRYPYVDGSLPTVPLPIRPITQRWLTVDIFDPLEAARRKDRTISAVIDRRSNRGSFVSLPKLVPDLYKVILIDFVHLQVQPATVIGRYFVNIRGKSAGVVHFFICAIHAIA